MPLSWQINFRVTKVSVNGQVMIPDAVWAQARINDGDELDVGYVNGLIVLRKRQPLTSARARSLMLAGCGLPKITPENEAVVAGVLDRNRSRRRLTPASRRSSGRV